MSAETAETTWCAASRELKAGTDKWTVNPLTTHHPPLELSSPSGLGNLNDATMSSGNFVRGSCSIVHREGG